MTGPLNELPDCKGNFFEKDQRLSAAEVQMGMVSVFVLEADRHVQFTLPKLRPDGYAAFPIAVPGPVVAKFQHFARHGGRIAALRIGGISRRLRCA